MEIFLLVKGDSKAINLRTRSFCNGRISRRSKTHWCFFPFFFKTDKLTRTQLNKDINYNITFTSIQRRSYRMPFLYRKMVIKQGIFSGHLKSNRNILLTNLNKKGSLSRYVYIYERPFFSLI